MMNSNSNLFSEVSLNPDYDKNKTNILISKVKLSIEKLSYKDITGGYDFYLLDGLLHDKLFYEDLEAYDEDDFKESIFYCFLLEDISNYTNVLFGNIEHCRTTTFSELIDNDEDMQNQFVELADTGIEFELEILFTSAYDSNYPEAVNEGEGYYTIISKRNLEKDCLRLNKIFTLVIKSYDYFEFQELILATNSFLKIRQEIKRLKKDQDNCINKKSYIYKTAPEFLQPNMEQPHIWISYYEQD